MSDYARVQREQAAEVLEKFQKGIYGHGGKVGVAIDTAIATLRDPQPDPITGLVPCGCGGEVYPHYQLGWYHEESGVQAFEVSTGCDGCGTYTKPRCGHYVNGIDEDDTESASKRDWNISHGYTDPPQGAHTANWQTETEGR